MNNLLTNNQQIASAKKPRNDVRVPKLRFKEFEGDWKINSMDKIFSIFNGYSFSSTDSQKNGIKWVKIADVGINEMKEDSLSYLPLKFKEEHKKFLLNEGDFVLALTRPILNGKLKIARITKSFNDSLLNQRVGKLKSENNLEFVYNLLQKTSLISRIENRIAGTDPPNLSAYEISSLKMSIPKLQEQQKIATFLRAVDTKIQQLNSKKSALETYKKGAMQQLFSQEIRFKANDGSDFQDWEEKKLGDISSKVSYGMNSAAISFDGKHKYLRITDIDEDSRKFIPKPLSSPDGLIEDKFKMKLNDIVFARTGASTGKSYLYNPNDGDLYYAGFLIKFNISKANPYFIYSQTFRQSYKKWVQVFSMRSGQPGLNAEEYKNFKISLPQSEEQQKIANYLSAIDDKIENIHQQIKKTEAFKKGLLQQLFV